MCCHVWCDAWAGQNRFHVRGSRPFLVLLGTGLFLALIFSYLLLQRPNCCKNNIANMKVRTIKRAGSKKCRSDFVPLAFRTSLPSLSFSCILSAAVFIRKKKYARLVTMEYLCVKSSQLLQSIVNTYRREAVQSVYGIVPHWWSPPPASVDNPPGGIRHLSFEVS